MLHWISNAREGVGQTELRAIEKMAAPSRLTRSEREPPKPVILLDRDRRLAASAPIEEVRS